MTTVYSFDLFDTLVCRTVQNPSVVFQFLESYEGVRYQNSVLKLIGFKKLRILAEKIARKLSIEEEVTLDEIYNVLKRFVKNVDVIKEKEISYEMLVLYPIDENLNILRRLLEDGQECCITSDMYLPINVIKNIIYKKLGVEDIKIFLSSDVMLTKHNGTIFKFIKDYYDTDYINIKHFGDNLYSDIEVPSRLGINVEKIDNTNISIHSKNLFKQLKSFREDEDKDVFYDLGFYLAGPCAWTTAKWMAKDLENKNIKKVFFGARDGYLFEKFFKSISDIPTSYFKISRSSLFIPSFAIDNTYHHLLFESGIAITSAEFFYRIGLQCPDHLKHLIPFKNQEKFIDYLSNINFFDQCQAQLESLIVYLRSIGFEGELAFFDLGWRGSLQSGLQNVLKEKTKIHGYYFGLTDKVASAPNHKAYFFYKNKNIKRKINLRQSLAFFEYLFTEPVQSLKRINTSSDGEIEFEYVENEDSKDMLNARKKIMRGAEDFKTVIDNLHEHLDISEEQYNQYIEEQVLDYICNPPKQVVDAFSTIDHSASFGGTYTRKVIEGQSFSIKDYRSSFWRSGYVHSLDGFEKTKGKFVHSILYSFGGLYLKQKLFDTLKLDK